MNLEHLAVAVRERRLPELYDLAALWGWRHGWRLLLLILIPAAPLTALDLWLVGDLDDVGPWYLLWLLLSVQTPFITAPISAYLGEALFSRQASVGRALASTLRAWWPLTVFGLLRGALAIPVVTVVLYPVHADEVLLLERQPLGATWKRAWILGNAWRADYIMHLVVAFAVVGLGLLALMSASAETFNVLAYGTTGEAPAWDWRHPLAQAAIAAMSWALIAVVTVVRFLGYIDLRTRREGWEVELDLRRASRRMLPSADA